MDWTSVAQDTDRWLAVMKLRFPWNVGKAEFWEILITLPTKGPMPYNKHPSSALSSVLTCKFVPVNKIKAYVAKEVYIQSFFNIGTRQSLEVSLTLPPFYLWAKIPRPLKSRRLRKFETLSRHLEIEVKISCPYFSSPYPGHYTDWATPADIHTYIENM
jgi:hypothetical protein